MPIAINQSSKLAHGGDIAVLSQRLLATGGFYEKTRANRLEARNIFQELASDMMLGVMDTFAKLDPKKQGHLAKLMSTIGALDKAAQEPVAKMDANIAQPKAEPTPNERVLLDGVRRRAQASLHMGGPK